LGFQRLGFLPGGNVSFALAISADGSTVVGQARGSQGHEAIRWRAGSGMQSLGA
jgi:uncharacterized membrane protein